MAKFMMALICLLLPYMMITLPWLLLCYLKRQFINGLYCEILSESAEATKYELAGQSDELHLDPISAGRIGNARKQVFSYPAS